MREKARESNKSLFVSICVKKAEVSSFSVCVYKAEVAHFVSRRQGNGVRQSPSENHRSDITRAENNTQKVGECVHKKGCKKTTHIAGGKYKFKSTSYGCVC